MPGESSLLLAGEYRALSGPESGIRLVSRAARFGLGSDVAVDDGSNASEAGGPAPSSVVSVLAESGSSVVGEMSDGLLLSLS